MRVRAIWGALLVTLSTATGVRAQDPTYYVALGDSLAIGIQPAANGDLVPTNHGYVDDLYALFRSRYSKLRMMKFGCSAARSDQLDDLGPAGLPALIPEGSQLLLEAGLRSFQSHRVALITLDIGGDNLLACFFAEPIDPNCAVNGGVDCRPGARVRAFLERCTPPRHSTLIVGDELLQSVPRCLRIRSKQVKALSHPIRSRFVRGFNQALETIYQALQVRGFANIAATFSHYQQPHRASRRLNVGCGVRVDLDGRPAAAGARCAPETRARVHRHCRGLCKRLIRRCSRYTVIDLLSERSFRSQADGSAISGRFFRARLATAASRQSGSTGFARCIWNPAAGQTPILLSRKCRDRRRRNRGARRHHARRGRVE